VYRTVGGHAYGTVYGGPIGSVISPYLQPGGRAMELPFASSLCGACASVCPVKIDLPELLVRLRARAMTGHEPASGRSAGLERLGLRAWAWAMEGPMRYRLASRALRAGLGPLTRHGVIRRLPGVAGNWILSRDLPAPAPKTFRALWRERTVRDGPGMKRSVTAASDRADLAASAQPEPGWPRPLTPTPEQLLQSFTVMSEDAQAPVTVVATMEAARARVREILHQEGARSVVLSPDATEAPWMCAPPDGLTAVVRSAASPDREALLAADAGVTVARLALADTGTLVLCSSAGDHRLDSVVPPLHIALLRARGILPDLRAVFDRLSGERCFDTHSAITLVRGPSRTADIELTLTMGVHGPEKVRVIVADC
jgi:L-lactate dehydrogenase complex protein LldF